MLITGTIGSRQLYRFAGFVLDLGRGALQRDGGDIPLRPKSFEVLRYLVEHPGQLAPKQALLENIWGHHYVTEGSLTQCVIDIRRALDDHDQLIVKTVPKRGYLLDVPVEIVRQDDRVALPGSLAAAGERGDQQAQVFLRHRPVAATVIAGAAILLIVAVLWRGGNDGEGSRPDAASPPTAAPPNSIAVLPFLDLSPGGDRAWFAEGLSHEILNLLAQTPEMLVISRTSSFSFKDESPDIPSKARRLNVAYVLEGSVRTDQEDVRISTQLTDAATNTHVWSESYDGRLRDTLALQSEIATAVAQALKVRLGQPAAAGVRGSIDPAAYEAYLQAESFYHRRAAGDIERAQPDEVRPHVEQARALGPNDPFILSVLAEYAWYESILDESVALLQRAATLEPLSFLYRGNLAGSLLAAGRDEEALQAFRRAADLNPSRRDELRSRWPRRSSGWVVTRRPWSWASRSAMPACAI